MEIKSNGKKKSWSFTLYLGSLDEISHCLTLSEILGCHWESLSSQALLVYPIVSDKLNPFPAFGLISTTFGDEVFLTSNNQMILVGPVQFRIFYDSVLGNSSCETHGLWSQKNERILTHAGWWFISMSLWKNNVNKKLLQLFLFL